jgi:hypothetical protein
MLGALQPRAFMGPRYKTLDDDEVGMVGFRDSIHLFVNEP